MFGIEGVRKNAFFALLSQVIRILTNLILFIGIARIYGPVQLGQFTAAHTFATIFLLFADFGFDILLASEVARDRARASEISQVFFSGKVMSALIFSLVMAVVASFQGVSDSTKILMYLFCPYVLISSLTNFCFALFKGLEQFDHETRISAAMNLFLLLMIFLLGAVRGSVMWIVPAFIASRVLGLILSLKAAGGTLTLRDIRFYLPRGSALSLIAIFGLHAVFSNLFFIQDTLLLSIWRGDRDVGIYQSVFKLITVIFIVPDVALAASLPVLSRFHASDEQRWNATGYLVSKTLFLLSLPIVVILFVFADQIIAILYGLKSYADAVDILRVYSLVVFFHFAAITYAIMLTSAGRQKVRMAIVVLATLINYFLNLYLIPRYGPYGAALASLTTGLFVSVMYVQSMRRLFVSWVLDWRHGIPFIAAVLSIAVLWPVRVLSVWFGAPAIILMFAAIIYSVGYSKDERKMMLARERVLFVPEG